MRPEDLLTWVRPFQPFRIVLVSGKTYEIRHPEMVRVGKSAVHVFFFDGEPADPFERMDMLSLLLIERIEPLDGRAKGKRKG